MKEGAATIVMSVQDGLGCGLVVYCSLNETERSSTCTRSKIRRLKIKIGANDWREH